MLSIVKADTQKVNLYNELSNAFNLEEQIDSSFSAATRAKMLAEKIAYQKGLAKSYTHLGLYYQKTGDVPQAIHHYFEGAKLWELIGGKGMHAIVAYANIGGMYHYQENYDEALKFFNIALRIGREIRNKDSEANSLKFIGNIYLAKKNCEEALKHFREYQKIAEEIKNQLFLSDSYVMIGKALEQKGDYSAALENHFTALTMNMEMDDRRATAGAHTNIGDDYFAMQRYPEALTHYTAALAIVEEDENQYAIAYCYNKLIRVYNRLQKYREAEEMGFYALKLANEMKAWQLLAEINESLSESYAHLNNAMKALDAYKASIAARDSIKNEEYKKKTLQMATRFEFEKKENAEKIVQQQKDALAEQQKKQQAMITWGIAGLLLLAIVFALFVLKRNRERKKANDLLQEKNLIIEKQKTEVEAKQKEILDSIHYAKRIQSSLLPTNKYLDRLLPGKRAPKDL